MSKYIEINNYWFKQISVEELKAENKFVYRDIKNIILDLYNINKS